MKLKHNTGHSMKQARYLEAGLKKEVDDGLPHGYTERHGRSP